MSRVSIMPVDFEPLYSASPPLFKHFSHAFTEYRYATSFSNGINARLTSAMPFSLPLRPCLILRPEDTNGSSDAMLTNGVAFGGSPSPVTSPTRNKKRVVFADDKGLALEHVKVMSEPSDCPPRWQDEFLEHVTRGATASVDLDKWEPVFAQPASDYVQFRRRLEQHCVCLENVITKETDESVVGTVKVKNMSYSKEVFVRVTYNRWDAYEDYPCTYVPSGMEGTSVYDLYDTFSFSFVVAPDAAKTGCVEFCVGFRCEGLEYWDNNQGLNYKLQASAAKTKSASPLPKFEDAFTARIDTWTEFASWNHLTNDAPYW